MNHRDPAPQAVDERVRLDAELHEVQQRLEASRRRTAETNAALQAAVAASQQTLAEMVREHELAIASVREQARIDADEVRRESQRRIAAFEQRVQELRSEMAAIGPVGEEPT